MSTSVSSVVIWGIPTCSTVKKARVALDAAGIAHRFRDLRAEPPTRADVDRFVDALGNKPLRNTAGASYKALGDDKDGWDDVAWARAFTADPMLLKRPVIERDGATVAAGFKDEEAILAKLR
ncbi:MAG TPA: Spx/MgsR family RNA polymerase-binding regulatory protein [Myxococcota bacterium]